MSRQVVALTEALVSRVPPTSSEDRPVPGTIYNTEADYDGIVANLIAARPPGPLQVFAYGSLMWRPEFDVKESLRATMHGWHRSFCIRVRQRRGSWNRPGLMISLDRGGSCIGILHRVAEEDVRPILNRLVRREMSTQPPTNVPGWVRLRLGGGERTVALAFTASRTGASYVVMNPAETAVMVATGAGIWGSCADYLRRTVIHLEELGIRDRNLWTLQKLVAERLNG